MKCFSCATILLMSQYCTVVAGVESIGGNGQVTIPSGWVVDQRTPILIARTTDYAANVTAFAAPVDARSFWFRDLPERNALIQAQWDSTALGNLQGYFNQGLAVVELDRQTLTFGLSGQMYTGYGGFTIDWTNFSFIYRNIKFTTIAIDAAHAYQVTTSVSSTASSSQQSQASGIVGSLSSTNTFNSTADVDGDGLRGDREFALGSSDSNSDSDGDGLSDKVESDLGIDPTQNQLPELTTLINDFPDAFEGVFTDSQVQAGRFGPLFLAVDGGAVSLTLKIQKSSNLTGWTEAKTVETSIPISDAKFFKFETP